MTTMRPIRETISLEEALATILEAAAPIRRTERILLGEAGGRVIAAPPSASKGGTSIDATSVLVVL